MSEEWFTVAEVARLSGASVRTVYRWVAKGTLKTIRVGGKSWVAANDLLNFKNSSK